MSAAVLSHSLQSGFPAASYLRQHPSMLMRQSMQGLHGWLLRERAARIKHQWAHLQAAIVSSSTDASLESTSAASCEGMRAQAASLAPVSAGADERFMRLALEQAQQAAAAGEVPVGALLVSAAGEVLAAARNQTEETGDPTAHAEMLCIRQAAARLGGWRLLSSTLYVTLEPCPMCAGALLQARVGNLVYGARNPLLGADGSWIAMLPQARAWIRTSSSGTSSSSSSGDSEGREQSGDGTDCCKQCGAALSQRPHPFHPEVTVRRGVLEAECSAIMRTFFQDRRRQAGYRSSGGDSDSND